jgi:hypothetical protein
LKSHSCKILPKKKTRQQPQNFGRAGIPGVAYCLFVDLFTEPILFKERCIGLQQFGSGKILISIYQTKNFCQVQI